MDKGNLEVLLFTLQSKMRANNKTPFTPREGKTIMDINKAWEKLEKAGVTYSFEVADLAEKEDTKDSVEEVTKDAVQVVEAI